MTGIKGKFYLSATFPNGTVLETTNDEIGDRYTTKFSGKMCAGMLAETLDEMKALRQHIMFLRFANAIRED